MRVDQVHLDLMTGLLGWRPEAVAPVRGGYTPAARYVVRSGGRSVFVKIATTPHTAMLLHREIRAYNALPPTWRPELIGASTDGFMPMLAIEDLSDAIWPPPWSDDRVAAVLAAIEALHGATVDLPTFEVIHGANVTGWRKVQAEPEAFLALKFASREWLTASLPALIEAEDACATVGHAPTHWDLRSDNMCLVEGRVKLIDWAEACLSNPRLDLGFWLPSLVFEGGPPPEAVLPDAPDVAAWVSGYFAARVGLPVIADAPFVRRVQREQLSTALPWVVRALRL